MSVERFFKENEYLTAWLPAWRAETTAIYADAPWHASTEQLDTAACLVLFRGRDQGPALEEIANASGIPHSRLRVWRTREFFQGLSKSALDHFAEFLFRDDLNKLRETPGPLFLTITLVSRECAEAIAQKALDLNVLLGADDNEVSFVADIVMFCFANILDSKLTHEIRRDAVAAVTKTKAEREEINRQGGGDEGVLDLEPRLPRKYRVLG